MSVNCIKCVGNRRTCIDLLCNECREASRLASIGVTEIGPMVEGRQFHGAQIPAQRPGEHLWIVVSMFRVVPRDEGKYFLDTENLLTIEGPGCYWCEDKWTPELASKPCKGEGQ